MFRTMLLSLNFAEGVVSLAYTEHFPIYVMYRKYIFVDGNSDFLRLNLMHFPVLN